MTILSDEGVTFSRAGPRRILRCRQWVNAGIERCFAFFADAGNLEAITPPFVRLRVVGSMPIAIAEGTVIDYRLSLMGLPLRWRSRIEDWRPGHGFTDVQLHGPYATWIHRHSFASADGGTWVVDEVEYALPMAPWSDPVHALFVRPRLRDIFQYRRQALGRLLARGAS